jgi:hypothetical protein
MIRSFTVKQVGERWVASGSCVLGPIDCSGATEHEAQALAVLQIKGYQRVAKADAERRIAEFRARKPEYFLRRTA